jgi:hypothetical protein
MYSPTKDNNNEVRIGDNNKKMYIIKGRRKIKKNSDNYIPASISK